MLDWGRAGSTSGFGFALFEKGKSEKPDLITIVFGTNHGETSQGFQENIQKRLAAVQEACPKADVVLISPMTRRLLSDKLIDYRDALAKLTTTNVTLADVTTPWVAVLNRKSFSDVSGNNFNHPNDFGHRLYARVICELFPSQTHPLAAKIP